MNLPADRDRFGRRMWRRRLPDDLTPEEREARIAELREKRRKRMRALAIRSTIGTSVLLVLAGVLLYWLLQTIAGRDALLAQVVARLPAGSSFTWQRIEGPLAGPLTLHGVDFRYGQIHFTAQRVYLDPDLRPLLGKRLRLDALEVGNATLDVPRSDEPFELPKWPDVLPKIEMPLAIQADALKIDDMKVSQAGEPLVDVRRARGGIDIGNGYLDARKLASTAIAAASPSMAATRRASAIAPTSPQARCFPPPMRARRHGSGWRCAAIAARWTSPLPGTRRRR